MPEIEGFKTPRTHWLLFVLRGVLAIVLGTVMLASPAAGLAFLVFMFGVYAIVDGILAMVLGAPLRFGFVMVGVLSILAGIAAFARPLMTATTLIYFIAAWAVLIGLAHLFESVFGRRGGAGIDWFVALAGIASVVLGGLILMNPTWGLLTVVLAAGVYAIASGISFMALGFRLRGFQKHHLKGNGRLAPA